MAMAAGIPAFPWPPKTKIIADAKKESAEILERANEKALGLIEHTKKEESERRKELQKTENR